MTASELQSLDSHSDTSVCSGLYTKSTPMWSTKMHASKLLKGVLISRTLNSSSSAGSDQESSAASTNAPARGKRAFSSDSNALTSASHLVPKKTSSSSLPVKTTCLCAPTKHAGSFRCRLHRVTQKHWDGRQIHPTSTSTAAASSSSGSLQAANENSGTLTPFVGPQASGCLSRTTGAATRPSRLRMVVVAQADETTDRVPDVDDAASPMLSKNSVKYIKVVTSTTIAHDSIANETGASISRKLHTSS